MEPERALVTGGTSFLGVELVKALVQKDSDVHLVIRPTSLVERLRGVNEPRMKFHIHDGSSAGLAEIVRSVTPDVVFHLAAMYRRSHELVDVEPLIRSNVLFGTQLLEAMTCTEIRRLVVAGTAFQHFGVDGYRPLNLYAATKQAFADVLAYYQDAHRVEAVILTLSDVYGSGDWRPKLIAALVAAQRSGEPFSLPEEDLAVDLVHVEDAVSAFLRAAELLIGKPEEVRGREYAVGSGAPMRLSEVAAVVEEVGGMPIEKAWGALSLPERRISVPWRGPFLPGWEARVSLREGVRRLLDGSGLEREDGG
jgi:nucleoside-diphosphate-sugar epimerase